jgi:hypothetical protein
METATPKVESQNQESWFKQHFTGIFTIIWIIAGQSLGMYFGGWINYYFFLCGWILILTNIEFIILKFWLKAVHLQKYAGFLGWLKWNLITIPINALALSVIFILSYVLVLSASIVPENISTISPLILFIGAMIFLMGFGFYLVEKSASKK